MHAANRRYFDDGTGRAVYLTGSHRWDNLQQVTADDGTLWLDYRNEQLPGGFSGYLSWLERHGHNFVRLWTLEHARDDDSRATVSPHPWARTGPGMALDGKPRFNLEQFDPAYFDRLRERVAAAADRGIYVSIMLFESAWRTTYPATWKSHPFNPANNVNGVNADVNGDQVGLEVHTLQSPAVVTLQEAYVRKVVDTVNDLDNVLYEIANESGYSMAWQRHIMETVRTYQNGKPKQHPVGLTVGWPALPEVHNEALFGSSADWVSPNWEGGYRDTPPAGDGQKVVLLDSDHLWGVGGDETWVWKSFLRGLNPIYMDPLDDDEGRQNARRAMGDTRAFAQRVDLVRMQPHNDLASSGYCLANPGTEYLVYLPPLPPSVLEYWLGGVPVLWRATPVLSTTRKLAQGRLTVTVDLSAAMGELSVEWFDPSTGEMVRADPARGGGPRMFTAPFWGDAVLYVRAAGE